jgi:hypothetical protein
METNDRIRDGQANVVGRSRPSQEPIKTAFHRWQCGFKLTRMAKDSSLVELQRHHRPAFNAEGCVMAALD